MKSPIRNPKFKRQPNGSNEKCGYEQTNGDEK